MGSRAMLGNEGATIPTLGGGEGVDVIKKVAAHLSTGGTIWRQLFRHAVDREADVCSI